MRRRIAVSMILLVLLLFPLGTRLIVSRCFDLSMERERERALSEEAAIARALMLELGEGGEEQLLSSARTAQARYGSQTLRVQLLRDGEPLAGGTLPGVQDMDALLASTSRATLLSGQTRTLYIAHSLGDGLMLLLGSDVAPVYALRRQLFGWAAVLCTAGVLLASALAAILSGMLTRPLRRLVCAAQALAEGRADTPLPPGGEDELGTLTRAFETMARAVRAREEELRGDRKSVV